jgi:hypothetical protein
VHVHAKAAPAAWTASSVAVAYQLHEAKRAISLDDDSNRIFSVPHSARLWRAKPALSCYAEGVTLAPHWSHFSSDQDSFQGIRWGRRLPMLIVVPQSWEPRPAQRRQGARSSTHPAGSVV